MDPARVSALLHAAARLAPADLVIDVRGECKDYEIPIEIPCFERATSIKLHVANLRLTLPAGREFPVLERVYVAGCRFDNIELISRCPRLRMLVVYKCFGLDTVKVHSPTIEELVVGGCLTHLDIVAPVLKEFRLRATMGRDFNVLFSAPMVQDLSWSCSFHHQNIGIGEFEMWYVRDLRLETKESAHVLVLDIDFAHEEFPVDSDLFQQIAPFPEFSVLEMYLGSYGHDFGGMMLDLLGACTAMRRLKMIMRSSVTTQACPPNCLCDEFPNWRSQTIPLTSLEEIEIDGFEGTGPEVAFLKFLFRCATLMKKMTVRTSRGLCPDTRGYKKMLRILETNPSVQCYVYRSSGDF